MAAAGGERKEEVAGDGRVTPAAELWRGNGRRHVERRQKVWRKKLGIGRT